MKKKEKKSRKAKSEVRVRPARQTLIWMVAAFAGLLVIVGLILFFSRQEPIPDDYFVTDDKKIVLSLDKEIASFENGEFEPEFTRIVYYRDGDKISNVKVYYEYETEEEAREAYDKISIEEFATAKRLNGRYIVLQARGDTFEGLTVDEVQRQVESFRAAGALAE